MLNSRTRPTLLIRSGLTLVEILIALTMTLIVLGAMMTAFAYASQQMQMGRGVMEMANRLRAAEELLRSDLAHATVDPRPYTESTNPPGYWEYVEGPIRDLKAPLTAVDTGGDGVLDGILDSDSDGIPDPIDVDSTGGTDADADGVDDRFDASIPGNSYKGDYDDVWMGTVRTEGEPFRGRYIQPNEPAKYTIGSVDYDGFDPTLGFATDVIESPLAEICWWTAYVDNNGNITDDLFGESIKVYRRVLLIRPGLNLPMFDTFNDALAYLATNDISARIESNATNTLHRVVANDLKDLANRRNRFCHAAYPNVFGAPPAPGVEEPRRLLDRSALWALRSADYFVNGAAVSLEYNSNDIILTDVAAFDLKVYSPTAGVAIAGGVTVEPGDVGFVGPIATSATGLGAFVDLGHSGTGWFGGYATPRSQLTYQYRLDLASIPVEILGLMETVYDTWTPDYESDGADQDSSGIVDQGTNGLDNGGTLAPDDDAERETVPPYPFPVRGVKVSIRLIEKTTKQIHQSSVIHSYVPE